MGKLRTLAIASVVFAASSFAQTTAQTAKFVVDTCSACHTVGGGDLVGPDLSKASRLSRADLEKALQRMQDNVGPLAPEQIKALADLLLSPDLKQQIAAAANPKAIEVSPEQKAASADIGRRLFFGEQPLANGGVPCVGCHAMAGRGGNLAVDLTAVRTRRNEAALLATAQQAAFPMMKAEYTGGHGVTRQEAYHLVAFLQHPPARPERAEHVAGIAGGIVLIALGGVAVLSGSRRAGMRSRLVRKSSPGE